MHLNRRVVVGVAGALLLSGLCSCSLFDVRLDKSDDGSAICVVAGTRIVVTLESNASTGYAWELMELDQTVVEEVSHTYQPGSTALVGAGGTEEWIFQARAAGNTILRMEYRRSFEPAETPAADTFTVDVTVQ